MDDRVCGRDGCEPVSSRPRDGGDCRGSSRPADAGLKGARPSVGAASAPRGCGCSPRLALVGRRGLRVEHDLEREGTRRGASATTERAALFGRHARNGSTILALHTARTVPRMQYSGLPQTGGKPARSDVPPRGHLAVVARQSSYAPAVLWQRAPPPAVEPAPLCATGRGGYARRRAEPSEPSGLPKRPCHAVAAGQAVRPLRHQRTDMSPGRGQG